MNDISPSDDPVSGVLPQADASGEAPTVSPAAPAAHALFWIPGIDPPSETNDLASVSWRLAIALDRAATSAATRFRMAEDIEEKRGYTLATAESPSGSATRYSACNSPR
jgi:hypothetical protein